MSFQLDCEENWPTNNICTIGLMPRELLLLHKTMTWWHAETEYSVSRSNPGISAFLKLVKSHANMNKFHAEHSLWCERALKGQCKKKNITEFCY